ncbi:uncharacterized protein Z518_02461 [Rhinocladiella mackenziei CBS 650.93]|uniref:Nudix hydrolase domain-containing protein n=1 Tax=Rhinocladiella mackenziei CBS 650.93 TaxID=1442369 RepID=A0A0D2FZR7_9EURO|nr:uncharacterized protein Z518_02461 [Rhinocladiella mackenziei CBS 650.93]KIX07807.1 hypothetical protein Z518_02461 [Rhinocladiella mackenziei CBS 650.93]
MSDEKPSCPTISFTVHPLASPFSVPTKTYTSNHPYNTIYYQHVATGALVFDSSDHILLIQRAVHDSMPLRWEVPGGACDEEDPSILHGVARELWEETGLFAASIGPPVGEGKLFLTRSGRAVCKFHFIVEVENSADGHLEVRLDPNEHQAYVWVTEEEVRTGRKGDVELKLTTKEQEDVIFEAFKVKIEGR